MGAGETLTSNLRISEAHAETENLLLLRVNLPGLQIDAQWHADPGDVHRGVEAALGEDVDQHRQGGRVLEERVFGVDAGHARDRVANHDRHHLAFNELDYPPEGFWLLHLVAVQPADEVLAGVADDFAGQRQPPKPVEGARIQLQRALIFQLADDVGLHLGDGRLGIDEVVVEDLLEGNQRVIGLLLEDAVAVARQPLAKVRRPFLPPFAHARAGDLLVVGDDLPSALELARHAFRLVDEEHHDVEDGLLEVDHLRGAGELPPQRDHLVEEQLEALDLHLGAREAVEQRAVLLLGLKQLAQEDADHLPVPDHAAARLDGARLRGVKELGNHDGRRLDAAHLADEVRVGAFARARRPPEQDQLLGETHPAAAELPL